MSSPITAMPPGAPSIELREIVLGSPYLRQGVSPLSGYQFLIATYSKSRCGVILVDGVFTRSHFLFAHKEAMAAGIDSSKLYVYADAATYSGRGISFAKLEDDLGIFRERESRGLIDRPRN